MAEGEKILIVDDDADIRRAVSTSLRRAGYEIAEAGDGDDGLALILKFIPDLIVLDMMMPRVNGKEFCERLVGEMRLRGVRVLLHSSISGNSKIVREIRTMDGIVSDFLQKPSTAADLKKNVEAMLSGEAPARVTTTTARKPSPTTPQKTPPPPPRASTSQPAPRPPRPRTQPEAKLPPDALRLLMVDDDLDLLRANKMALRKQYAIATAENGLVGIELLDSFNPDFVLVDFNMPVMDGLEMVETMRHHPSFRYIPALFLSGNREQDLPKRAFESGCNLFLRKPIDPHKLGRSLAHFVKESGIKPGSRPAAPEPLTKPVTHTPTPTPAPSQTTAAPTPGPAPTKKVRKVKVIRKKKPATPEPHHHSTSSSLVRLVIVGADPGHKRFLEKLLGDKFSGRIETLWAEDYQTTLVNLPRWEPDILLYNPRAASLEGIGFFQMLRIKKVESPFLKGFVGAEIPEPDREYSRRHFGNEVIDLTEGPGPAAESFRAFLKVASERIREKRFSLAQINSSDKANDSRNKNAKDRDARQQAALRERYGEIQQFIDRDMGR